MEIQLYNGIRHYLTNHQPPRNIPPKLSKQIINKASNFRISNDKLYFIQNEEERRVIREDEVERILFGEHSDILAGHFNIESTYQRIRSKYYWPRMYKMVEQYVKSCDSCQRRGKPKRVEALHPIPVGDPFDQVGIDIVGPLTETTNGNRYIIVATEYLTKWPEARAISDTKASTVAKFIYEEIICRHGAPKVLLSDRGSSFLNEVVDSLCNEMGIRHALASAYHPQTNGLTERFNKTLCETIAKYILQYNGEWDKFVQSALFAYRTKPQKSTKFTPFFLMYGRKEKTPLMLETTFEKEEEDLEWRVDEHVKQITERLGQTREMAKNNIKKAQDKQKEKFDEKVKPNKYEIGEEVLLFDSSSQNVHGDKFREKWTGPFYIHEAWKHGTYKLRNIETGMVMRKPINGARLKRYFRKPAWEAQILIE
jgi:hypothetical protein